MAACRAAGSRWALVFLGIGAASLVLEAAEGWAFGAMGQRLATRVRVLLLRALLHRPAAFFDAPQHSSGALLGALAADAGALRGAVGDRAGHLLTLLSCVLGSYALAFRSRRAGRRAREGGGGCPAACRASGAAQTPAVSARPPPAHPSASPHPRAPPTTPPLAAGP